MDDWLTFEGQIRPLQWGDSVYTVLPIPDEMADRLRASGARRVEVELNDHSFNMALTKAPPLDQTFVYTGKSVLKEAQIEPGERIDVRIRKTDPDRVDLPADVQSALLAAGCLTRWETLSPGKRRGALHQMTSAKRAETRAKRLGKLIRELE